MTRPSGSLAQKAWGVLEDAMAKVGELSADPSVLFVGVVMLVEDDDGELRTVTASWPEPE